jgi:hypothetical protein
MSTALQLHPRARHRAFWAFVTGFLLAVLLTVVQMPSPTHPARSDQLSYSDETAAIACVLDSASAVSQDTGSPKSDKWPTLFDMDIELVTKGDVLNKWSHARVEIARDLQIVDRCRKDNVCPAGAQRLIDLSSEGAGRNGRARLGFINRAVNLAMTRHNGGLRTTGVRHSKPSNLNEATARTTRSSNTWRCWTPGCPRRI